jgi:hypothetical protein
MQMLPARRGTCRKYSYLLFTNQALFMDFLVKNPIHGESLRTMPFQLTRYNFGSTRKVTRTTA